MANKATRGAMQSPRQQPEQNEDLIATFLKNQKKELELKATELELQKQTDQNSYQFSIQALQAQAQDRAEQRAHGIASRKVILGFVGVIVFIVFAFLAFTVFLGKDQITMEVIKAIIYLLAGGGGGFAVGRAGQRDKKGMGDDEQG